MAQQFLHDTDVGTASKEVRRERVAPLVRVKDTAIWEWVLPKDTSYVTRVHPFCGPVQKHRASRERSIEMWAPFIEVFFECRTGRLVEWEPAVF